MTVPNPAAADRLWLQENRLPAWLEEIRICLSSSAQFVLAGNIHDRVMVPGAENLRKLASVPGAARALLFEAGYDYVLDWDQIDGLTLHASDSAPDSTDEVRTVLGLSSLSATPAGLATDVEQLTRILEPVTSHERRGALTISYASRLTSNAQEHVSSAEVERLFFVAEKLSRETVPHAARPYNPIFWLVDADRDLPRSFTAANEGVRVVEVSRPDRNVRALAAYKYYLLGLGGSDDVDRKVAAANAFAAQSHDMALRAMEDIWRLAKDQQIRVDDIEEAVRSYRVGVIRNPWIEPELHQRIASAEARIAGDHATDGAKVFGQPHAVNKSVDILMRSSLNLSSAQAQGNASRPRGVLFFAGPTGVGKTQLAKAINKLVFDADEPIRFDMSEFSSEHAEARLIGAPPGFLGHGKGGELTNQIRQRPFSVVLFDELEKAHPRIFDKFLQLLDEGRLTDGSGQTVYFSEAIIVFTTNWGMFESVVDATKPSGERRERITRGDLELADGADEDGLTPYERLSRRVQASIVEGFEQLERPELLNRIGQDNIIVFDFIDETGARRIFETALQNVTRRVEKEQNVELHLDAAAVEQLWEFAWQRCDTEAMGGRGIGDAVETALVNPLARLLYDPRHEGAASIQVRSAARQSGGSWKLEAVSS